MEKRQRISYCYKQYICYILNRTQKILQTKIKMLTNAIKNVMVNKKEEYESEKNNKK